MKNKILVKGFSALAALTLMGSCASDYLDLRPITDIDNEEVTATVEAAQMALYGVCTAMQCQYQGTNLNQMNGEGYINSLLNDCFGQDLVPGLGSAQWGTQNMNMEWTNARSAINAYQWMYLYTIINRANIILDGIDNAEGDEDLRDFVKAQALTFRAFAYEKLLMFYAPRWEDSNNGEAYACVLRLTAGTDPLPLVKMNEVIAQIRADLDLAIELYNNTESERTHKWEPDLNVAYGVYTRLALLIHDWPTAQQMAHNARQGYPVMDNNTYLSGFYMDNSEIMWTQGLEPSDIYYWSWGSHFAANGVYTDNWKIGANAIDMTLYRMLDEKDIRRKCYLTPDKISLTANNAKITETAFWDPDLVGSANYLNLGEGPFNQKNAVNGKWGLYNVALQYCYYYLTNVFTGNISDINNENFMAYYTQGGTGDVAVAKGVYGTLTVVPFGAQLKFFSYAPYGTSAYPFMRGAEMCIAEAEAAYHNGDMSTALSCLKEINGKRIEGYNFTATDASLLEEIKLCRRIELWGEGQAWSDFKRWNMPLHRNKWVPLNQWEENGITIETAGNWLTDVQEDIPTTTNYGWRFVIPSIESDYNSAVDISVMGYTQGN